MFITCFGGVGLRIANGVGGGLNSMSAFYVDSVIGIKTDAARSSATFCIRLECDVIS